MSEIIRCGGMRRCALIFVVLFGSLAVCLGQDPAAAAPDPKDLAKQDAAKPEAANPDAAKPDVAKDPATPPPAQLQETPAASPAPPVTPPADSQPASKKKGNPKNAKSATASGPGQVTAPGVQKEPYKIGPEDVLYLNVLHQQEVSQNLEVRPDGYVSVRFAGEIQAAGLTTPQLAAQIAEKLKTYFNNPEVNIQVLQIRSKKYYISGEVRKAGAFPLTAPKTIYEALIEAGGLADFAKSTKIYVLRGEQKIPFNYKDVSKGKHLQQNILLQNGDVIVVP